MPSSGPRSSAYARWPEEFGALVRTRNAAGLEAWLVAATESPWRELGSFATGVRRDRAAVDAGLTLDWNYVYNMIYSPVRELTDTVTSWFAWDGTVWPSARLR